MQLKTRQLDREQLGGSASMLDHRVADVPAEERAASGGDEASRAASTWWWSCRWCRVTTSDASACRTSPAWCQRASSTSPRDRHARGGSAAASTACGGRESGAGDHKDVRGDVRDGLVGGDDERGGRSGAAARGVVVADGQLYPGGFQRSARPNARDAGPVTSTRAPGRERRDGRPGHLRPRRWRATRCRSATPRLMRWRRQTARSE